MEIVCDESGYEGEKLIGTTTDVFAHSSVHLAGADAASFIQELRDRIRSPATQYKANHVLREKHRRVLRWLLGPDSPLRGRASVYLIDKERYLLRKLVDHEAAEVLYHQGRQALGEPLWTTFLSAANDLLRGKETHRFEYILEHARPGGEVGEVLALLEKPAPDPALDPLIPGIVAAVTHWGSTGEAVSVVHDRQKTLTPERIAHINKLLNGGLNSLTFAQPDLDLRVQVADVIGGAVRKVATDELNGVGDPELSPLVSAFVNPASLWGDKRSWAIVGPAK